jgi:Kef-type K+ transport system membrane component KefB
MEQELITLGILFGFALIGGIIASKFKQPTLLGLLVVGALIGPKALGLVHDAHIMESMIEFGAILMLFVLGLEFDIPRLQKIGLKAITIAALNSAVLIFVGFTVSVFLGLSVPAALFMGVILAFGSTVVIVKVLENKGYMDRQEVPLLIAVLIIEDIIAVIIITFFSGVQDKTVGLLGNIESLILSMITLVLAYVIFVKLVKPALVWIIGNNNSEEITTFTALAMCAGFAYLAYYLHLSPAVGAFLAGSIVASLPNSKKFEHAIAPYNLIISAFFFIAIGTLIDLASIKSNIMIILVMVLTVILTKIIAFSGIVYFFANMKGDRMFFSSIAMFSVGEFSLLVAKESTKFNVGVDLISISAAIVALSALIMSVTINYSDKMYEPTREWVPFKARQRLEKFSEYIKAISEELDLDNRYSKGLKANIMTTLAGLIGTLLVIFGWRRLYTEITYGSLSAYSGYLSLGYALTLSVVGILLFYVMFKSGKIVRSLADIFSNATNNRSAHNSRTTVKRAFASFGMFWLALLWPFIMFLVALNTIYVAVSFVLFGLSVWQFHKISAGMEDHIAITREQFPSYRKMDYKPSQKESSTREINMGWKL